MVSSVQTGRVPGRAGGQSRQLRTGDGPEGGLRPDVHTEGGHGTKGSEGPSAEWREEGTGGSAQPAGLQEGQWAKAA